MLGPSFHPWHPNGDDFPLINIGIDTEDAYTRVIASV